MTCAVCARCMVGAVCPMIEQQHICFPFTSLFASLRTPRSCVLSSPAMASLFRKLAVSAVAHSRSASTGTGKKVVVIGAAGGIGQPLGLLMKMVRARVPGTARAVCAPARRWKPRAALRLCAATRVAVTPAPARLTRLATAEPAGEPPVAVRHGGHARRGRGSVAHEHQGESGGTAARPRSSHSAYPCAAHAQSSRAATRHASRPPARLLSCVRACAETLILAATLC
jgi:hypothetical protein